MTALQKNETSESLPRWAQANLSRSRAILRCHGVEAIACTDIFGAAIYRKDDEAKAYLLNEGKGAVRVICQCQRCGAISPEWIASTYDDDMVRDVIFQGATWQHNRVLCYLRRFLRRLF